MYFIKCIGFYESHLVDGLRVIRRNCNWQIKLGKFLHKVLRSRKRTWIITYVYDAVRLYYNCHLMPRKEKDFTKSKSK
jgi:hypothetical protein